MGGPTLRGFVISIICDALSAGIRGKSQSNGHSEDEKKVGMAGDNGSKCRVLKAQLTRGVNELVPSSEVGRKGQIFNGQKEEPPAHHTVCKSLFSCLPTNLNGACEDLFLPDSIPASMSPAGIERKRKSRLGCGLG